MKKIVDMVMADRRYMKNIEYGKPRSGHPEGKIKYHIAELEENLEKLAPRITKKQYWKLKFLIHVHDTFKADALPNSPIESPNSHASLARMFASEFTDDEDLLNMIQFHDVNYALWKQYNAFDSYSMERFNRLLETIRDWDLFLLFLIIDGNIKGKDSSILTWFIEEVRKFRVTRIDSGWILQKTQHPFAV